MYVHRFIIQLVRLEAFLKALPAVSALPSHHLEGYLDFYVWLH